MIDWSSMLRIPAKRFAGWFKELHSQSLLEIGYMRSISRTGLSLKAKACASNPVSIYIFIYEAELSEVQVQGAASNLTKGTTISIYMPDQIVSLTDS